MLRKARMPQPQNALASKFRKCLCGLMILATTVGASGCRWLNRQASNPFGPNAEPHVDLAMSQQGLIDYVNANAAKLGSWRSTHVKISGGGLPIALRDATIAVEAPRNFRLLATKPGFGGRAADLGSNDEYFWFWFDGQEQPDVIMCNHEDVGLASRVLPIPFEPDWLMEVMGVKPLHIDPDVQFVEREGALEVYTRRTAPNGAPVTKRTTIDRRHGNVIEHALLDAAGRTIAQANVKQFAVDGSSGAVIPVAMDLNWPQAQMKLTLEMDHVEVNPDSTPEQFQVPQNMQVRRISAPGRVRESATDENRYPASYIPADLQQPPGYTDGYGADEFGANGYGRP